MSFKVENMEEKNMVKLVIEATAEEFEAGLNTAFNKNKNKISVPGFRKGKAPRKMVEKLYGTEIFYEDAANAIIPDAYAKAADESELEIVSQPKINVVQIEAGKPFIFEAVVAVKPEVELGQYKGVEVEKCDTEVTDADVEEELKKVQDKNSRVVTVEDRAVKNGDMTTIDFEGFVDGVAFEGGKGENYDLEIGSNTFIPGFEDQLVGAEIGKELDVNVTFPEEYGAKELAGKPAKFEVKVKEIKVKELPELNDEFASEVSDFETLAEYKEDLKKTLIERKEKTAAAENENKVIDKVTDNAQMDIPEAMIKTRLRGMFDDYARRLQSQGLDINQYMQFTGMTRENIMDQMKPQAVRQIKTGLVLEKIAEAENIQVEEAAIDEEIAKMAEAYKMEADKLKGLLGERELEQMKKDLAVKKAVELLVAEAKLV